MSQTRTGDVGGNVGNASRLGTGSVNRSIKAGYEAHSQNPTLKEFRFKPTKGPFEPWYCGIVEPETERALETWWECPHCSMEFKNRKACVKHCIGITGQFPALCHETKTNGKCFSGCEHP